jgi:FMN-dependent oxidoreductase (nitrilotriacetate monooxygenase family)
MDEMRKDRMSLGAFIHPTGNHVAAWLHPGAQVDAGTNFEHYVEIAQIAEAAKFDLMFLADAAATRNGQLSALRRWPQYMAYFEPITLLSGIAARTSRLGLVATATTSYNHPFHVARKYGSLDHISHGRAGWNVVTSSNHSESFNFGLDEHLQHADKYERALEFVDVVKGLWDSWEDDAFLRDRATAEYFDPEKLHHLNHKGKNFTVRGPLNLARPPQGHPVIAQAGNSTDFRDMAGRHAEIVFTAQHDLASAQTFYRHLKDAVGKHGRDPAHQKILPGLNTIVAATRKEAEEKFEYLQSLIHPDVGREVLSNDLGYIDLSGIDIDDPIPESMVPAKQLQWFRHAVSMTGLEKPSMKQMYAVYGAARGQRPIIGSPSDVADEMARWFHGRGADGFLVHPAVLPESLKDFCNLVVPVLQDRGLFREDYEGSTLRDHLGVPRPVNRHAAGHQAAE